MAENEGSGIKQVESESKLYVIPQISKDDKEREYAAQFFDFIPTSFVDELSEVNLDLVTGSLEVMKANIEKKQAGKFDQEHLDKCFETVTEKFSSNTEKVFEKLGSYVGAHILKVPSHVLLSENSAWEGQTKVKVEKNLSSVNCEMVNLKNNIKKSLYMKAVLSAELSNLKIVCDHQEEMIADDDKLYQAVQLKDTKDIVEFIGITERDQARKKEELVENMMGLVDNKRPIEDTNILDSRKKKLKISELIDFSQDN